MKHYLTPFICILYIGEDDCIRTSTGKDEEDWFGGAEWNE